MRTFANRDREQHSDLSSSMRDITVCVRLGINTDLVESNSVFNICVGLIEDRFKTFQQVWLSLSQINAICCIKNLQ